QEKCLITARRYRFIWVANLDLQFAFERQVLNERFHDIVEKYKTYQGVKENVRDRENDTIKNKEVKR
ncbi:hypothetical protein P7H38_11245, partial [Lactococcus raffinolactis]|uniref:hypothetical protein n=1 Tax=Pseudolactococcus raffinolactis TaxID=1366 RepID=UPI00288D5FC4